MGKPHRHPPAKSAPLPDLPCACATARRAARLITQLYGEHLHGFGLEAAQLSLLSALGSQPGTSQKQLALALGLDKTTLSRNLKLLYENGWVRAEPAEDHREARLSLTAEGRTVVHRATPQRLRAQNQLQSAMTPAEWKAMWTGMKALTRAAHQLRSSKN